jgi:hypothetical protein
MKQSYVLAVVTMVGSGCLHGQRAYMDAAAKMDPEPAAMWSRPQEVGYTLGERLQGEATNTCILKFICWGAEDGGIGGVFSGVIGALTGQSAPSDPLVRAAAAGAVLTAPVETDGIYVLNHETDSFDIFFYSRRSARVVGKAVRLRPMGEVAQDRADKERYLKAVNGSQTHTTLGDLLK